MAMTMTEKILARSSGKNSVAPGENVWVNVDVLMTHDVCGPSGETPSSGATTIAVIHFDRGKVYVRHVLTHDEYDEEKWKDE